MLTRFKALCLGLLLAVAGLAGLVQTATAQNAPVGFNPATSLQGFPGLPIALGAPPTVTGCNTSAPTVVGGVFAGKITTVGTTTCAPVLTWVIPALGAGGLNSNGGYSQSVFAPTLTGVFCTVLDLTTVADLFTEASTAYVAPTATAAGSISCTFTSRSITSGDVLLYAVDAAF